MRRRGDAARCPRQAERDVLLQTLRQTGYNVSECARQMQISRVTVYRLCRKHRLELPAQR